MVALRCICVASPCQLLIVICRLFVTTFVAAMAVLRDKVLQQLPIELTNSWISIVDERKFNADVGAHRCLQFLPVICLSL